MKDVFDIIKNHSGCRFIYGTGDGADKLIDYLETIGVKPDGICVSDEFYRERKFRGFNIKPISVSADENKDALFLMAFGTKQTDQIFSLSQKLNLLYPEMPVCGTNPFTKEVASTDKNDIETAFSLLADDESKKVFENIINFRLSGNISYLKECESEAVEGYKLILNNEEEIIFDCGAYKGDTADEFFMYSSVKDFYAAEPCPKNFEKLKDKYSKYHLFNCAVGKEIGEADFVFNRGRGSTIHSDEKAKGKIKKIPLSTVDELIQEKPCTVIKYDVEGSEVNALLGSVGTINKHHPNLLVAAYHRPEDIYKIPLTIHSISKNYKIYLRHLPCLPSWETNVYAVYKKS